MATCSTDPLLENHDPSSLADRAQKINLNTTNHEIRRRKSVDSVNGIENCDDYDKISHYLHP